MTDLPTLMQRAGLVALAFGTAGLAYVFTTPGDQTLPAAASGAAVGFGSVLATVRSR